MPQITRTTTGVAVSTQSRVLVVLVRNSTGSAGSVELINDVTNNPTNHVFTVPCPVADMRGFNVPEGLMFFSNGVYVVLTSVSEVCIVYG